MRKPPLKGLVIRTATLVTSHIGFIFACDLKKEKKEIPHAIVFTWSNGNFGRGECNYNAMSACGIAHPALGAVYISEAGYYSACTQAATTTEDIFANSAPPPKKRRARGIRSVSSVSGTAYAVGIRGMVYRLDRADMWTRIDDGLPDTFDAQAIHGFDASDLYAVGFGGQVWHYDGSRWERRELATNLNLTAVKCAGDGTVYIGGHGATLFQGRQDQWTVLKYEDEIAEDIWDLEWFQGALYISTLESVFCLKQSTLQAVDFGKDKPKSCYQLSATKDVLWSNGEFDVMAFDGKAWTRIV
jgi:hypothetical protein